jgi:hypothetical protein
MRHLPLIMWLLAGWAIAAYLLVPSIWKMYFRHHRSLTDVDRVTRTADGHPGDPINIGMVGTESQVIQAMTAAEWFPADPITVHSSVRIVVDSVFRRPDDEAPVSSLFLFSRKQDWLSNNPSGTARGKGITCDSGARTNWKTADRSGSALQPSTKASV